MNSQKRHKLEYLLHQLHDEDINNAATLLKKSNQHYLLSPKTLRLIISFSALVIMSIVVAKDHLFTGTLLALLYSSMFATYALYSMFRLRLARQRFHWVGD